MLGLVDLLKLFLDGQCLRHGHCLVAGELIFRRENIDFVFLAEPLDGSDPGADDAAAEGAPDAEPETGT